MTDVFRECRERVSAQDVARHYGLTFDRKGWALCPFHLNEDLGKLIDAPLEAFSIVEKIRALEAECYCERKLTKWRKSKKNTQAGSK